MNNIKLYIKKKVPYLPKKLFETKEYKGYKRLIEKYETWNENEIKQFQNKELKKLLRHCYTNVPFYKELYDKYNIDISKIESIDDLVYLPIISKDEVKNNIDKFIARNISKRKMLEFHTGGTTSTPMRFFNTKITHEREKAIFNWIWNKNEYLGIGKQKSLILRGNYKYDKQLYEYDKFKKYLVINPVDMDGFKIENIINLIYMEKIEIIQAYPSLIYLVAKYINENTSLKRNVKCIKRIFCSSEKIYEFQIREIKKAFENTEIIDYYGHNERTTILYRNSKDKFYKDVPIYGITEIVNNNGLYSEIGERGNIIGTSFNNYAFPLIRYDTKDSVRFSGKENGHLLVQDIDGRAGDFIVTKSGKYFSPTILEFAIRYIDNFRDIQLVQNAYEKVIILIVPDKNYKDSDGEKFKCELEQRVNYEIDFEIELVKKINKPSNCKSRFVVCNIK